MMSFKMCTHEYFFKVKNYHENDKYQCIELKVYGNQHYFATDPLPNVYVLYTFGKMLTFLDGP